MDIVAVEAINVRDGRIPPAMRVEPEQHVPVERPVPRQALNSATTTPTFIKAAAQSDPVAIEEE